MTLKLLNLEKRNISNLLKQLKLIDKEYKKDDKESFESFMLETGRNLNTLKLKKEEEISQVRLKNKQKKDSKNDLKMALALSKAEVYKPMTIFENNQMNLFNNPKFKDMAEMKEYECEICFTSNGLEGIAILDKCGHFYCLECMRHFLDANVKDRKLVIKCPSDGCKTKLLHNDIRMIGTVETFELYERYLLENTLGRDKHCKFCPRPGCGMAMYQIGDNPMLTCPKCEVKFCFNCNTSDWHTGVTCKNFKKWKKENGDADALFEKWKSKKKKNVKKCPRCKVDIQKNGGCNHMHCSNCNHNFNWSDQRGLDVNFQ